MQRCTKGYNWGIPLVKGNVLQLNNASGEDSSLFEVSLNNVRQVQGSGKEVSLTFNDKNLVEGVTEIRFFVPVEGVLKGDIELPDKKSKPSKDAHHSDSDSDEEEEEGKKSAAAVLLEGLKAKCEEDITGRAIAQFSDVLVLAPKARLDFDVFKNVVRVRGKKQSWLVNYTDISQMFLLPAPDCVKRYLVIALAKPIKSGQTPYHHLVLSFDEDNHVDQEEPLKLNVTEEELNELNKEQGPKLTEKMDGPMCEIVAKLFKVLSGAKVIGPSRFLSFASKENLQIRGVSCSHKAQAGALYPLERSFFFLPKPAVYIRNDDIDTIKFRNAGQRFFDIVVTLKHGAGFEFQAIDKNEEKGLLDWMTSKELKVVAARDEPKQNPNLIEADSDEEEEDEDFDDAASSSEDSEDEDDKDFSGKDANDVKEVEKKPSDKKSKKSEKHEHKHKHHKKHQKDGDGESKHKHKHHKDKKEKSDKKRKRDSD